VVPGVRIPPSPPASLYLYGLIADEQQNARGSALLA
jgi:hypothetical protein